MICRERLKKDFDPIFLLSEEKQITTTIPKEHPCLKTCSDLRPFLGKKVKIVAICMSKKNGGKPYLGFVLPGSKNLIDCTIKPDYLKLSKSQLEKLDLE